MVLNYPKIYIILAKLFLIMIKRIAEDILEKTEGIESIYFGGSRAYGSEKEGSDWDLFGIVNEDYDFGKESHLNRELSDSYDREINFRGISLEELNGGEQKGVLTRHIPLNVILKSFRFWDHLTGKKYSLEDFKLDPATDEQEKKFYLNRITKYREEAEKGDIPFLFEDYVKTVLLLIGVRQVMDNKDYTMDYERIGKRSEGDEKELASMCMRYRKTGDIDKDKFFEKLDYYLSCLDQKS